MYWVMPSFSNAALLTMAPPDVANAVSQNGANGRTITSSPLWVPVMLTWSSASHLPAHSDSFMRSKENLTSAAVNSPWPPLHWSPGLSLKAICKSSVWPRLSTKSVGIHFQLSPAAVTARRGSTASWVVASEPPIM